MSSSILITGERVGSGAMGSVYKAQDPAGKIYALKVLEHSSPSMTSLFEGEVQILSKLKHPGLVEVSGFSKTSEEVRGLGSDFAGVPHASFWMEFVEGRPILEASK